MKVIHQRWEHPSIGELDSLSINQKALNVTKQEQLEKEESDRPVPDDVFTEITIPDKNPVSEMLQREETIFLTDNENEMSLVWDAPENQEL